MNRWSSGRELDRFVRTSPLKQPTFCRWETQTTFSRCPPNHPCLFLCLCTLDELPPCFIRQNVDTVSLGLSGSLYELATLSVRCAVVCACDGRGGRLLLSPLLAKILTTCPVAKCLSNFLSNERLLAHFKIFGNILRKRFSHKK